MATSTCCLANPIAVTSSSRVFRRSRPRFVRWIRANPPPIPKAAMVHRKLVSREVLVRASGPGMEKEVTRTFSFLDARDGEELLSTIKNGLKMGRLPPNVALAMEELYWSYRDAVFQSGIPNAEDIVLSNMSMLLERILLDIQDPFTFLSYHKAIREPYDYYMLGQRYIRPLIDFRRSYVGNIWIFQEIEDELRKGHNVVLVSNHQTEADPAVIALLIERRYPHIAEEMTFVAGDRVITDPLSKPFSMGRNLLCVYSKKHLYDVPELAEMKKKSNTRSLKEMALLLRAGGQIIWIAPSGGRDRPDHMTGECFPAMFDAASISNIRRLADHSGVPVHLYPLALLCYDMMPPPAQVEKEIGERRDVSFHGVGLSIGHQVHYDDVVSQLESFKEIKSAFSQVLYNSVNKQYGVLKSAIYDHQGLKASTSAVSLSQPW